MKGAALLRVRWLAIQPKIIILDEPTRGIDIGARQEIETLIAGLSAEGLAVLPDFLGESRRLSARAPGRSCCGNAAGPARSPPART